MKERITQLLLVVLLSAMTLINPGLLAAQDLVLNQAFAVEEITEETPMRTQESFTFSANIPAAPNYVQSSIKNLAADKVLKVLINSSTGSKPVKMQVIQSSTGKVLSSWKNVWVCQDFCV